MFVKKPKISFLLLLSGLAILPGCSLFKKSDEKASEVTSAKVVAGSDKVLISANGKPVLTEQEFESFLEQAAEADPQAKMMLSMMPEAIKEQALDAKKRSAVISEWAKHEGIRDTKEYKERKEAIFKSVEESLDHEAFMKKHKAEVTDKDAKDFYDKNKVQDPRFKISEEGTKSFGVEFDSKEKAQAFLDEIKNKVSAIENEAESKKLKTRDFGIVNKDSYQPKAIKNAVLAAKVPSVQVVQDGKEFWVVAALSKEAAKYHSFDDLKEGIKRMLEGQKMEETMDKELPKYEQKHNVTLNQDYLKDLQAKKEARENEMKAQFEASQKAEEKKENKSGVKELAQSNSGASAQA